MSDDEDVNIAGNLALTGSASEDESEGEYSYNEAENYQEDIISSSDEEDEEDEKEVKKSKKAKETKKETSEKFPELELSDDDNEKPELNEISTYFTTNNPQAKKAKKGTFQSFGFSKFLMANIIKRGYKQPTPIQRKTIPLIMENRDVVGMARTGSGKTAAFVLPLIEKLKSHSPVLGARALILSPSRELALQTFRQVKEFSRGTDLRTVVLVGGDSLEDHFSSLMNNPDIVVATPGRFLHLKVEMQLDLLTMEYVVFDEADRLFEMGFAEQLNELLAALPASRQTLLFSATLPKTLVGFAKAGLTSPVLVRLDAESKISDQLEMAFFACKKNEREANLLYILQEVIKIPLATPEELKKLQAENKYDSDSDDEGEEDAKKKKKRKFKKEKLPPANVLPSPKSTIIFVPTKHHVEYVSTLLKESGYLLSYIYGSLDQRARNQQLYNFKVGLTSILVVTDVAARGIDIPVLANVINFTLPASSKIFVHRVGRTARAGNKGWAYSIVNEKELPYLLDLELFLGRKVLLTSMHEKKCEILKEKMGSSYVEPKISYSERLVLGSVPRLELGSFQEFYEGLLEAHYELRTVKGVAEKGEKLYHRTRQAASQESLKRSKEILETENWDEQHLLFGPNLEKEKENFLNKLANRKHKETVFEFHKKSNDRDEDSMAEFMNKRRKQIAPLQRKAEERKKLLEQERLLGLSHGIENELLKADGEVGYSGVAAESVDEKELQEAFEDGDATLAKKKKSYRDPNFFISHYAPISEQQNKQMALDNSFALEAGSAGFDLQNDDTVPVNKQVRRWDKKKGKYVNADSTDKKYIISENGQRIPASFRSGRFDEWKKQRNISSLKVGSVEANADNGGNKRFKHKKVTAPKLPDKYRDDFQKQKMKVQKALETGVKVKGYNAPGQKDEIKSSNEIRKARELKDKRRAKNARPSKKRKL